MSEPGIEFGGDHEYDGASGPLEFLLLQLDPVLEEVHTLGDYRRQKAEIDRAVEAAFDASDMEAEPYKIVPGVPGVPLIDQTNDLPVDFSFDSSIRGFAVGLYVIESVADDDLDQEELDLSTLGDEVAIELSVGLRIAPIQVPEGCDPETSLYQLPIEHILDYEDVVDNHPLEDAIDIFDEVRDVGIEEAGLTEEVLSELYAFVDTLNQDYPGIHRPIKLTVSPGSPYQISGLSGLDAILGQRTAEAKISGTHDFELRGFSLHLLDDSECAHPMPVLAAKLKFMDEADVVAYGGAMIEVLVEDIRFGKFLDIVSLIEERDYGLFARERIMAKHLLLECLLTSTRSPQDLERAEALVGEFITSWSCKTNSKVALKVATDGSVEAVMAPIEGVQEEHKGSLSTGICDVEEGQEIHATIRGFQVTAVQAVEDDATLEIDVVPELFVKGDPYFDDQDVLGIVLPDSQIEYGQILRNPNLS